MAIKISKNRDFWTGMMFVVIGLTTILVCLNYPYGNLKHMGPGFFPTMLGGILTLMGIYTISKNIREGEKFEGSWSVRALIILPVVMALTGLVMKHWGFIPATVFLLIGSASAGKEAKISEVLLLTVCLTTVSAVIFIWALKLPFHLFGN